MNIAELIRQTTSAKPGKRKHRRQFLRLPMEYSFPESGRLSLAYTVDISEGGLLMHVPEKLAIGQNLKVRLYYIASSGIERIELLGEVIRSDKLGKSGKEYRCAVRFGDLPNEITKKLWTLLDSLHFPRS